jgi:Mg2+-importing ATPase
MAGQGAASHFDVPRNYWSASPDVLLATLETSSQGLSEQSAQHRRISYGENRLTGESSSVVLPLLRRQFASPLVLILLAGAIVSMLLRDWSDALIILVIVSGGAALGFTQEYRASCAVEALRQRLALNCTALRNGQETKIPVTDLVPGDVVRLSAGNLVPADGIILRASDFMVSQAVLTGESFPVEKQPGTVLAEASLAERRNMILMGSSVRSGTADALIVQTGRATEYGAIAQSITRHPPETDFARGVRHFGELLLRMMFLMVIFVLAANQVLGRPFGEALLFAVALSVGLSPELLPAIVSITLATGARHMAKQGVIVRRLEAIEMLGSMDIVCTDKTGTITSGEVTLVRAIDPCGSDNPAVLEAAFRNAALETGIANALDAAIVRAGANAGLSADNISKIDEIPYDFNRRRLTIVVADGEIGQHRLIVKGAVNEMLEICMRERTSTGDTRIDEARKARLVDYVRQHGEAGFRVLALAEKGIAAQSHYTVADEAALTLTGFLLFSDPPKEGAKEALTALAARRVAVKIVSGDNRYVTARVAEQVGLDATKMLTGAEVAAMGDEALWHAAENTVLFVEVDPQQKEQIVRSLQRKGHAVGFIGDGINDAPALHSADVGISVEGAVDVARESADIVLLTADLDVLRRGVEDGRRTFANTMKYIMITTSANFGNMLSMAIATPLLPFLPLLPKQILLNNFLSDFPSMAIAGDSVDEEHVATPQRWDVREIGRFMALFGAISSLFDGITFLLLIKVLHAGPELFHSFWFIVSILTELGIVLVLRTRRPCILSKPGTLLVWSTLAMALLSLLLPYMVEYRALFGFTAMGASKYGMIIAIVGAYLLTTEGAKLLYFRMFLKAHPAKGRQAFGR